MVAIISFFSACSCDLYHAKNCKVECKRWTWKWRRKLKDLDQGTRQKDNLFLMRWKQRRGDSRTFSEVIHVPVEGFTTKDCLCSSEMGAKSAMELEFNHVLDSFGVHFD